MLTLKELQALLEKAEKAYEESMTALADADGKKDIPEADLKTLKDASEKAEKDMDTATDALEEGVKAAEKNKRRKDLGASAKSLAGVKAPFGAATGSGISAEPTDGQREELEVEAAFVKYCERGSKGLSGQEVALLEPKSSSFESGKAGVVMPKRLKRFIFGRDWVDAMDRPEERAKMIADCLVQGKALPAISAVNTQGGFLVPPDFRPQVFELPTEEPHILPRATVVRSTTGTIQFPRLVQTDQNEYGAVAVAWTGEGQDKPEAEAKFEQVTINTHELSAWTQLSHRLLKRSAIDLEGFLGALFRRAILSALDNAFLNGTGVGQPLGILQTAGIRVVARAGAAAVSYADLVNLKYALQPYHRAPAIYIAEDGVLLAFELTLDALRRPIFTPSVANGIFDRLLGRPYIGTTRQPTVGNQGDMIFLDPKQYIVAMEEEIVVRRSDDYDFPKNVASFAFFMVAGGQDVQPRTVAVLGGES